MQILEELPLTKIILNPSVAKSPYGINNADGVVGFIKIHIQKASLKHLNIRGVNFNLDSQQKRDRLVEADLENADEATLKAIQDQSDIIEFDYWV